MKKFLFLCLSICLLTGCTKNYKTVEDFSNNMKEIKSKKSCYTIEAKQTLPMMELYYKSYFKDNKWKTEVSMNQGKSYFTTILYDGEEIYSYASDSTFAIKNPMLSMLKKEDEETKNSAIRMLNPTSPLLNWEKNSNLLILEDEKPSFINHKDKRNDFDCHLIKFSPNREACIIDKYGIAAYHKLTLEDPKNKKNKQESIINLVKIETKDIPDSTFNIPEKIKKMNLNDVLENINKTNKK